MEPISALDEILVTYALTSKNHPDALGEILRAWAFPGDKFGCYSTFDVRNDLTKVEPTSREFELLFGRAFDPEPPRSEWGDSDTEYLAGINWFKHPNGIEFGWHWDGDGLLAFFVPELADDDYTGGLVNHDCKKDHGWRFQERPFK